MEAAEQEEAIFASSTSAAVPTVRLTGSPLALAVCNGSAPVVLRLLRSRADPTATAPGELTPPLVTAVSNGNIDIACLLLLHSADPNSSGLSFGFSANAPSPRKRRPTYDAAPHVLELQELLGIFRKSDGTDEAAEQAVLRAVGDSIRPSLTAFLDDRKVRQSIKNLFKPSELLSSRPVTGAFKVPSAAPLLTMCSTPRTAASMSPGNLQEAVEQDNVSAVLSLLCGRADPNPGSTAASWPLHVAAKRGQADIAAALLLNSADPDSCSIGMEGSVRSPVARMIRVFQTKSVTEDAAAVILGALGTPMKSAMTYYLQDLKTRQGPVVPTLSIASCAPNIWHNSAALTPTSTDPFKLPSSGEAPGSARGCRSLSVAVERGDVAIVLALLRKKVNPNVGDPGYESPLICAAMASNADAAAALLLHSADPRKTSSDGRIPLDVAKTDSVRQVVLLFFQSPPDLANCTSLMSSLSFLVRGGLSSYIRDCAAEAAVESAPIPATASPLSPKSLALRPPLDDFRLREPARATTQPPDLRVSSLEEAASAGDAVEVLRCLKEGANVNVCDDRGMTPLFGAVAASSADTAAILLLHSADPNSTSNSGQSAVDFAKSVRHCWNVLEVFKNREPPDELERLVLSELSSITRSSVKQYFDDRRARRSISSILQPSARRQCPASSPSLDLPTVAAARSFADVSSLHGSREAPSRFMAQQPAAPMSRPASSASSHASLLAPSQPEPRPYSERPAKTAALPLGLLSRGPCVPSGRSQPDETPLGRRHFELQLAERMAQASAPAPVEDFRAKPRTATAQCQQRSQPSLGFAETDFDRFAPQRKPAPPQTAPLQLRASAEERGFEPRASVEERRASFERALVERQQAWAQGKQQPRASVDERRADFDKALAARKQAMASLAK